MSSNPPTPTPIAWSRRVWLARCICLAGAWAGLHTKLSAAASRPLPWNQPIPLGRSGLQVTRLGFGCEETSDPKLIQRAADAGINHFNSFPNRGDISNFRVVGEGDTQLLTATVREASPRLCRLCPTCNAECQAGLPIPEVMRALMYAEGYGDLPRARKTFAELRGEARTNYCDSCPRCTALCPHGVSVRDPMRSACASLA